MTKPTVLYSGAYLAEQLGTTRETVFRAMKSGKLEEPAYVVENPGEGRAPAYAWTGEQVKRIKKTWEPGKPGRPKLEAPGSPPRPGGRGRS